jgi:hypothetical protein
MEITTLKQARANAWTIGKASKMPGTTYGIPAQACKTGSKLHKVKGSICNKCYALNGNYQYPSVKTAQERRLASLDSPHWIPAMVMMINHAQTTGKVRGEPIVKGYHRWHDSGDVQSVMHLGMICEVARRTPKVKHWLPLRELKMLLDYITQGGTIPPNLIPRVSATMIDGRATTKWKWTSEVHSGDTVRDGVHDCPARFQDNSCGDCRACWNSEVETVSYHEHG